MRIRKNFIALGENSFLFLLLSFFLFLLCDWTSVIWHPVLRFFITIPEPNEREIKAGSKQK